VVVLMIFFRVVVIRIAFFGRFLDMFLRLFGRLFIWKDRGYECF